MAMLNNQMVYYVYIGKAYNKDSIGLIFNIPSGFDTFKISKYNLHLPKISRGLIFPSQPNPSKAPSSSDGAQPSPPTSPWQSQDQPNAPWPWRLW